MDARAKFLGHPIHQMVIVLPLGLLSGAVLFDLVYLATGSPRLGDAAFWALGLGIVTGLFAAVFGLVDWTKIPSGTRAKRVGIMHAASNVLAILFFAGSWLLRYDEPTRPELVAIVLGWAGGGLALLGGWFGGELVDRLGVGVHEGAHVDAPNSLSHRPVSDHATV